MAIFGKKHDAQFYLKVVLFAVGGCALGLLVGLVFGSLISYIAGAVAQTAGNAQEVPPFGVGTFLGMGVGAAVGGIAGLIAGYKD